MSITQEISRLALAVNATPDQMADVIVSSIETKWNGAHPTDAQVEWARLTILGAITVREAQIQKKVNDAISDEIAQLTAEHELTKNDGLIRIIGGLRKAQGLLPNL